MLGGTLAFLASRGFGLAAPARLLDTAVQSKVVSGEKELLTLDLERRP